MSEPIRVLHFADSHIGIESYGKTDPETGLSSRVVDFLRRMDDMVNYARENDVDLVIFAGDAFKTRSPNPTFQREFAWRVRDLSEMAPVVLLVGNHDLPPSALKASSIEIYDTLAVPNVLVAQDYDVYKLDTKRGPVIVGTAPYPIRSRILEDVPTMGLTIAQTDAILQQKLTDILDQLAEKADELAGDSDTPRLLTGHFTISGAVYGSERSIMLGRDVSVLLSSVADLRWDYVAMGHIHKHQDLTKRDQTLPSVVYSGSIERVDFGEEGDDKGFCWVSLQHEQTTWEFVKLNARNFFTIRADLTNSEHPTAEVVKRIEGLHLEGAVVRLILKLTPETEAHLNENAVRDALKRARVFHIAVIRKDIDHPSRARLGASPEGLTQRELLERYLLSKEISPERRRELLEAAEAIFDTTTR